MRQALRGIEQVCQKLHPNKFADEHPLTNNLHVFDTQVQLYGTHTQVHIDVENQMHQNVNNPYTYDLLVNVRVEPLVVAPLVGLGQLQEVA